MSRRSIDTEELCREYLEGFLRTTLGDTRIDWRRVPQRDQPPDYYLELPGARFAVEVTSLVETVCVGGKELPAETYAARCRWLAKEIERRAKEEGVLRGRYALCVVAWPDIASAHDLVSDAVDYIHETMKQPQTTDRLLLADAQGRCFIRKLGEGKNVVHTARVLVKGEQKAGRQALGLVQERIRTKAEKLQEVRAGCPRVILLLYDAYLLADWEVFEEATRTVAGVDFFHSVSLVGAVPEWVRGEECLEKRVGLDGHLLYDRDGAWCKC